MRSSANGSRTARKGNKATTGTRRRIPRRAIDRVAKSIADKFDPERIILFGSYAYGKPHPFSDVDLLVVMETTTRPLAKQQEISRALSPHPFGMDILVRTPRQLQERIALGDAFLRDILTKGQVLYKRPRRELRRESRPTST